MGALFVFVSFCCSGFFFCFGFLVCLGVVGLFGSLCFGELCFFSG